MNPRLPRAAAGPRHAIRVPPPADPPGARAPIGEQTLRAAYEAHKDSEHDGNPGRGCNTCRRYLNAVVTARSSRAEP